MVLMTTLLNTALQSGMSPSSISSIISDFLYKEIAVGVGRPSAKNHLVHGQPLFLSTS